MLDMIDRLISREGGARVTTIQGDPGKTTKFGISATAYPQLDIANLTYDQAKDIYIRDYYLGNHLQLLPDRLGESVLDFCVHSGSLKAVLQLQKLLGVAGDGVIGPKTVAAVEAIGDMDGFIHVYNRERIGYLIRQVVVDPANKLKFLLGWVMRVLGLP